MCRLAAFPPNFPRNEAIEILRRFENNNTDGTGAAWIEDRKFIVEKYPRSLSRVLRRHDFLDHMPHNGWTIAHLRAASHGDVSVQNTHPFVAGKWVVCHNGTFSEFKIVRLAFENRVKFEGETDTEVAAHVINQAGPKRFAETVDWSGVFLALNLRGDLWVAKTSGDLELQALKHDRVLLASTLDPLKYDRPTEAHVGWYHFDREGHYIKHKKVRDTYQSFHKPTAACGSFGGRLTYGTGGKPYRPNVDDRNYGCYGSTPSSHYCE